MSELRECKQVVVAGRKRIGKSNETLRMIVEDYIVTNHLKKGRKALLLDTNNEYGTYQIFSNKSQSGYQYPIKRIALNDIKRFSMQQKVEVVRVTPRINDDGTAATDEQIKQNIIRTIDDFRGGCLLVEDLNVLYGDSLPLEISGLLTNNGHRDTDLIFHIQSVGRLLPKILQNTEIIRFHKQHDSVDKYANRLADDYTILKIAEMLVDKQYYSGNTRYFVYVNREDKKIIGKYSARQLMDVISDFVKSEKSITKRFENMRDLRGKKVYTYQQALELACRELFKRFYGNNNR